MSEQTYDYTEGDIPVEEIDGETFVLPGTGATTHDAEKIESENLFLDPEPGVHLFEIAGFGPIKRVMKTAYINKVPGNYETYQAEVRLACVNDRRKRTRLYLLMPPATPAELKLYNFGTNEKGTAPGFMSKIFVHFMERLMPGQSYKTDGKGNRELTDLARNFANWKGRKIWGTVEMGKAQAKLDETTGLEVQTYAAKPQVKSFSWVQHVEGGPDLSKTVTTPANGVAKPASGAAKRPAPKPAPELQTVSSGLGDI